MSDSDDERGKVRYLDEIREPGEGWAQQEQFIRVIQKIDDESDHLVKFLRAMRMAVTVRGWITEEMWAEVLFVAETLIDYEHRSNEPEQPE